MRHACDHPRGDSTAPRHVLSLTDAGRRELLRRLRDADGLEITDGTRFFTVLAFLSPTC